MEEVEKPEGAASTTHPKGSLEVESWPSLVELFWTGAKVALLHGVHAQVDVSPHIAEHLVKRTPGCPGVLPRGVALEQCALLEFVLVVYVQVINVGEHVVEGQENALGLLIVSEDAPQVLGRLHLVEDLRSVPESLLRASLAVEVAKFS